MNYFNSPNLFLFFYLKSLHYFWFFVELNTKNMISNSQQFRDFKTALKKKLTDVWDEIPERDRGAVATKIAAALGNSKTTVLNYFLGIGTDPETALDILEKYNELLAE